MAAEHAVARPLETTEDQRDPGDDLGVDANGEGLSKLQLLRNQFRSKIVEEKERKLSLLNKKQQATSMGKQNRKVGWCFLNSLKNYSALQVPVVPVASI